MKTTLTIGITAYNEEANIKRLLDALLIQKTTVVIGEILVVSDASTDKTDEIVSSYKNQGQIRLIRLTERGGQNKAQNRIHSEAKGDILVVLDADILPSSESFIEKIIAPIVNNEADLVGAQLLPATPSTFFESMLAEIHMFKVRLYGKWKDGKNIYMCFGPTRGFSKRLYSTLRYPDNCPTDAYSYIFAMRAGYIFAPATNAPAIFKNPSSFKDHMRQSSRFTAGKDSIAALFGAFTVHSEFSIPYFILFRALVVELILHPVYLVSFMVVHLRVKFISQGVVFTSRWEIAGSTKNLK